MREITLQLTSGEGDRLGHLVRGVQMLRSYGQEFVLQEIGDVMEVAHAEEPDELRVLVTGTSTLDREGLRQLCQEVQWSLGAPSQRPSRDDALGVEPVGALSPAPGERGPGLTPPEKRFLDAATFMAACAWGQRADGHPADVIGERPGL